MVPCSVRFLTTELDPVTGIYVTQFNMISASALCLVVAVSILVVENDSSYPGFSSHDEQMGDTAVDARSGTI